MSLSFHFSFQAPATASAGEPESFFKGVGRYAKSLGLGPAIVRPRDSLFRLRGEGWRGG